MNKYSLFAIMIIGFLAMFLLLDASYVSAEEADQGQTWEINKEIILSKLSPEEYQKYIEEEGNTLVLTPNQILIAEGGKLIIDKEVKTEKEMVIAGNLTIANGRLTIAKAGKVILEKQGTLSVNARSTGHPGGNQNLLDNGGSIEIITGEARSDTGLLIDKNVTVNTGNVRLCKSSDEAGYSCTYSKDPIGTQLSFANCFKATSYQIKDDEGQVPIEEDTVLNAGDYTLKLEASGKTYKSFEAEADLTIAKADISDKGLWNEQSFTYDKGKKVQDITDLLPAGFVFLEDGDFDKMNKYGEKFPVDVGTYKLNVNYAESSSDNPDNYNPFPVTVTIKKGSLNYPGGDLSATVGQTLKDIKNQLKNGYAFTVKETTVLAKGRPSYPVNYKSAQSYANPTLNPNNFMDAKVFVQVKSTPGQDVSAGFEKLDINKANIDKNKIDTYNDLNNKYNKLTAAEKKKLSAKANNNRNNGAKVIKECRVYPDRNIYYRYGNNTLTLFGSGKVKNLYTKKFKKETLKKKVKKDKVFHNNKGFPKFNTLVVESGITYLGNGSFAYLPHLKKVVISGNKTTLGETVFLACKNLETIELSGVKTIGFLSFGECKKLKTVTLNEGLENINWSGFAYCSGLKTIVLPETVKKIGYAAFSYCSRLQTITFNGKVKKCGNYAFFESGSKTKKSKRIVYYKKAKPAGKLKKQLTSAGYSIKKKK